MSGSEISARKPGNRRIRALLRTVGVASIGAGLATTVIPAVGLLHRGQVDQAASSSWNQQGAAAVAGPVHSSPQATSSGPTPSSPIITTPVATCGGPASGDYALVEFNNPAPYMYAGIAGNGTWDLLTSRSMVHYAGTPDPGQQGNVIIAFHREPNYQHIDQLTTGGIVTIQDSHCATWRYRITQRWKELPSQVTQLAPTSGHDLTLITCDPFWQDTQRLVWRGQLID